MKLSSFFALNHNKKAVSTLTSSSSRPLSLSSSSSPANLTADLLMCSLQLNLLSWSVAILGSNKFPVRKTMSGENSLLNQAATCNLATPYKLYWHCIINPVLRQKKFCLENQSRRPARHLQNVGPQKSDNGPEHSIPEVTLTHYTTLVPTEIERLVHTHAVGLVGLLRQQETRHDFLPVILVEICLELEHRLRLVLGQPQSLEVTVQNGERQELQPEIQHDLQFHYVMKF